MEVHEIKRSFVNVAFDVKNQTKAAMMLRWSPEYPEIIFWALESSIHKGRHQKLF